MKSINDFLQSLFAGDFKSEYSHANRIEQFEGKQFFQMDCSGFAYWVLFQTGYKRALAEIRQFLKDNNFLKINRLFCKDFAFMYEHADAFKYWRFVSDPVENSILVVAFPDTTGHCMFVDKVVRKTKNGFCIRVYDSTRYPHQNDTRKDCDTGLGIGEIKISMVDGKYVYDSCNPNLPPRNADVYFVLPIK